MRVRCCFFARLTRAKETGSTPWVRGKKPGHFNQVHSCINYTGRCQNLITLPADKGIHGCREETRECLSLGASAKINHLVGQDDLVLPREALSKQVYSLCLCLLQCRYNDWEVNFLEDIFILNMFFI